MIRKFTIFQTKYSINWELFSLFALTVIEGLYQFEEINTLHTDIRPHTILIENSSYKLTHVPFLVGSNIGRRILYIYENLVLSCSPYSYTHFLLGGKGNCYLAPELLLCLKDRELNVNFYPSRFRPPKHSSKTFFPLEWCACRWPRYAKSIVFTIFRLSA